MAADADVFAVTVVVVVAVTAGEEEATVVPPLGEVDARRGVVTVMWCCSSPSPRCWWWWRGEGDCDLLSCDLVFCDFFSPLLLLPPGSGSSLCCLFFVFSSSFSIVLVVAVLALPPLPSSRISFIKVVVDLDVSGAVTVAVAVIVPLFDVVVGEAAGVDVVNALSRGGGRVYFRGAEVEAVVVCRGIDLVAREDTDFLVD